MTYTALHALSEMNQRPAFKRRLVGLLELAKTMAQCEKPTPLSDSIALDLVRTLGQMICSREKWDAITTIEQEEGK